jgi:endonuclease/exonuclease/phosphatase family metal-dependent hydrolase
MDGPRDASDARPSRRSLLRAAGTAAGGVGLLGTAAPTSASGADTEDDDIGWSIRLPRQVCVATRNLGLGANLYGFIDRETLEVDPSQVYDRFQQVRSSAPAARMRAIAAGVADDLPAVVGLQEAALVRRGSDDYEGGSEPNAETVVFDFLELFRDGLTAELDRYGFDVGYEVAAVSRNVDEEFPAEGPDDERFDVRLTDRDVMLVRHDLTVRETAADTYSLNVRATLDDGTQVSVTRGYALAEVALEGAPFTVVTTHLAFGSSVVRESQAAELSGLLAARDGPVILAGDLNTTPEGDRSGAYRWLVENGLTDAWAATREEPGPTCCQNPRLRNDRSRLGIRVDMVLAGGSATPLTTRRRDVDPEDRITVDTPDGEARLWPSDHAGVVADVLVEPRIREPLVALRGLLFDG